MAITKKERYIMAKEKEPVSSSVIRLELTAVKTPNIKESSRDEWVRFGDNNDYPQYLLYLLQQSSKHNAIIKGKVNYIIGGGFEVETFGSVIDKALINSQLKKSSFGDTAQRLVYDFEVFNAMCCHVAASKDGKVPHITHIDVSKIRISKDYSRLFYSEDWTAYKQSEDKTGFKELPLYNPVKKTGYIYYRHYTPDVKYYSHPEYIGAVPYIDIDTRIASFHLNNLANGFSAGTLINFADGVPSDQEKPKIERALKKKFTGDDKAGEIILTFSNGQDRAPQVLSLQSNNFDKLFDTLKQTASEEIFTGHQVTSPMLFGVKTASQLGGRTEIVEAHELFKIQYVQSRQKEVEGFLNGILDDFELKYRVKLNEKAAINERLSEQTLTTILTKDELREIAGYKPLGTQPQSIQMASDDKVLLALLSKGEQADKFDVINVRGFVECSQDAHLMEIGYYMKFAGLKKIQQEILSVLSNNGAMNLLDLSKAVNSSLQITEDNVNELFKLGYLRGKIGVEMTVTDKGIKELGDLKEIIEVKYRYALRPNAPALVSGGTSRSFCKTMMGANRLYDRADIEGLSNGMGLDVWRYRGGWYTNPNTDVSQPSCRHMWEQVIVRRKA